MVKATVEIGHTYVPDLLVPQMRPGSFEFGDSEYAERLRGLASALVPEAITVALIDDVAMNARDRRISDDSGRLRLAIGRTLGSVEKGTEATRVFHESDFEGPARKIVERVRAMNLPDDYRLNPDGSKVIIGSGKKRKSISITGFKGINDPEYPSCQTLDLAWLQRRLEMAPEALTVLPIEFRVQQSQVEDLARLLPEFSGRKITSIFVDDSGNEISRHEWFGEPSVA